MVRRLARFVVSRSWDDLSEHARKELKIRVLDAFGCAFGALTRRHVERFAHSWRTSAAVRCAP